MNAVAAMAMVLMILLSANMGIVGVAAQGVNCYDNCNTGCAGLPCMSINSRNFASLTSVSLCYL
uniref:Uncharacterized protein n=1 Tax=Solanum tuberosum TaxID=4113 RepID=M1CWW9_SOLTU